MTWLNLVLVLLRLANAIMRHAERRRIEANLLRRLEAERHELNVRLMGLRQRVEHMSDEEVGRALEGDYRD